MADDDELLGLSEVAELLQTSRQVVGNWRGRRPDFPSPRAELKSGPIWRRADIVTWADEAGMAIADDPSGESADANGAHATVAIVNMKGGVGKSTLAANLGWYCAYKRNKRVLLVDLDPQFNLSQMIMGTTAYEKHVDAGKGTVLDILEQGTPAAVSGAASKPKITPDHVITHIRAWKDGSLIDLIPSSLELAWTLRNPTEKEHFLEYFLDGVRPKYDLILIDCPPTESMLTTAAYLASDSTLVPVKPEFLSTIGLPLLVKSLSDFQQRHRRTVEVMGILFNAASDKVEHDRSRSHVRKVAKKYGWPVFRNEVSYSDSYAKGSRFGTPIFLTNHARAWKITEFYAAADEFVKKLEA